MFEPTDRPRVFGLPPGADFTAELLRGVQARMQGRPPHELARVQIVLNTQRMSRRLKAMFDAGPATLLPRIDTLSVLKPRTPLPEAVSPIRRRLELITLISALLNAEPDLAPRAALYDLADSLAKLLDEMQGENVTPEDIAALDVTDMSGHWARAQKFLNIVNQIDREKGEPDPEERQRGAVETLIAEWQENPPQHPILLAGSTGSRGAMHLLMQAVARLPQGAVILPGVDFHLPDDIWSQLDDPLTGEDHPQFRFRKLMNSLEIAPSDIVPWVADTPCNTARNRLMSLALRPAPVTHQWLEEGPRLQDLEHATGNVTLLKAPGPRAEALAIALRLRKAAEDGQSAALITPDRMLTRQVSSALGRWGIIPDDSAGIPLQVTPPGRLLRQAAQLFVRVPSAVELLTLLKHPLTHTGSHRGWHLELTRDLELYLRRKGRPHPGPDDIAQFISRQKNPFAPDWAEWLLNTAMAAFAPDAAALSDRVEAHIHLAEQLAQGAIGEGSGALWEKDAGEKAHEIMGKLAEDAPYGGDFTARDYADMAGALIAGEEVRNPEAPHPHILIWGAIEARVQGADLVILGGLNEGSWPEAPDPDPWLNRQMRKNAGLLLPDRRIGLSAHDFQQAIGAREVWLSRSIRSQDAETVPSRWLNRMTNLLGGLDTGREMLEQMEERGERWLALARQIEVPDHIPPAPRPSPAPPVEARPHELWVTDIEKLIRDPYAIYAKRVLRLRSLNPLMREADAMLRGTVSHAVFETFIDDLIRGRIQNTPEELMRISDEVLEKEVPWAEIRALWRARMGRVAEWFTAHEEARQQDALQILSERAGHSEIEELKFKLSAKADRIDLDHNGRFHIFDYKTGAAPSDAQQKTFKKQLLLEAAIGERDGFGGLGPRPVARAVYISVGSKPEEKPAPLDQEPPSVVWEKFTELMRKWHEPERGYTARRAMFDMTQPSDYDQLSRYGEWDVTLEPNTKPVK